MDNACLDIIDECVELKDMTKQDMTRQDSAPFLFSAINAGNLEGVRKHLDQSTEHINSSSYGGLTPLHAACHMQQLEILILLVSRGAKIHCLDSLGNSALHVAAREAWASGIKVLLEYGASPNMMSEPPNDVSGQLRETPLHAAVRTADMASITLMLKYKPDLSIRDRNNYTVFHLAAATRNDLILKQLLRENDSSKILEAMKTDTDSLFHAALPSNAKVENESQILKVIQLVYKCSADINVVNLHGETPLILASRLALPSVVKFLLTNEADPTKVTRETQTALHTACIAGCSASLKHLLSSSKVAHLIIAPDSKGNSPFYYAVESAALECCKVLLKNGDHLTNLGAEGISNCSLALEKLPSAMQLFNDLFDSSVKLSKQSPYDPDFSITFDYSVLMSSEAANMQSSIASELGGTPLESLIKHPLLESFLCIKWSRIRNIFYFNVLQYCIYLVLHTAFILISYGNTSNNWVEHHTLFKIMKILHVIFITLVSVPAIIVTSANLKKIIRQWETYTRLVAMVTSAYIVFVTIAPEYIPPPTKPTPPTNPTSQTTTPKGEKSEERELDFYRGLASVSVLFVWVEFMMLLGRFPALGTYILMFTKVAKSLIKFIAAFFILIIGFSLSFHVLFQDLKIFSTFAFSLAKTIMMMTGEIAYSEIVNPPEETSFPFHTFILVLLCIFVFMVTIIMSNLLIGLAVDDIPFLKRLGKIKRLIKQASYLMAYETVLNFEPIWKCFPSGLRTLLSSRCSIKSVVTISPNKDTKRGLYFHQIPAETITEAIKFGSYDDLDVFDTSLQDDISKQFQAFQKKYSNDRRTQKHKFDELAVMCADVKTGIGLLQTNIGNQLDQITNQLQQVLPSEPGMTTQE